MTLHLVLIGDVGDDVYHVGDEAMFETAMAELAARADIAVTAVTAHPDTTTARYGVAAVPHLGFDRRVGSAYDANRERRLVDVLDGTATDGAAVSLRTAVEHADAVLVCGGGNLSSSWPHLLYERLALLELAAALGIPTVVTGQTIGPTLTARQAARLGAALGAAAFVGVRDLASAQLVRQLAADCSPHVHQDDAAQLPAAALPAGLPDEYVAFTVHGAADDDQVVERYLDFAVHIHATSGLPVVLVPHTGALLGPEHPGTDADLMSTMCKRHPDAEWLHALPVMETVRSAAVVRHAAALVSARFHPLVFALSHGVPCIGLTTDRYTDIKIGGALAHHGVEAWRLPHYWLGTGAAERLFDELWRRRSEMATHLLTGSDERRAAHRARWDLVARCLAAEAVSDAQLADPSPITSLSPDSVDTGAALTWDARLQQRLHEYELAADRAEEYALSLRDALDQEISARHDDRIAAEREAALLRAEMATMRDELALANRSADAARDLAGRMRAVLDHGPEAEPPTTDVAALQRELDAMRNTKLFRWTAPARRLYGRLRTSGSHRRS